MPDSESISNPQTPKENLVLGWMEFTPGSTKVTCKYDDGKPGLRLKIGELQLDAQSFKVLQYLKDNILGTPHQKQMGQDGSPGVAVSFVEHNGICTVSRIDTSDRYTTNVRLAATTLARMTDSLKYTPEKTGTLLERVKSMMAEEAKKGRSK